MNDTVSNIGRETDALRSEIATLREEIARLRQIESIAVDFCSRCERGEIRSTSTYERFRAALGDRANGSGQQNRKTLALQLFS